MFKINKMSIPPGSSFNASSAPWFMVAESCYDDFCSCATPLYTHFMRISRSARHRLVMEAKQRHEFDKTLTSGEADKVISPSRSYIVSRIGSESSAANVFQVCSHGVRIACKVMPNNGTTDKIQLDEVIHAGMVSNLVLKNLCPFFPVVYFARRHVPTALPPSVKQESENQMFNLDNVSVRARLNACRSRLIDLLLQRREVSADAKERLRENRRYLETSEVSGPRELKVLFGFVDQTATAPVFDASLQQALQDTPYFPSTLLFSELAHADLGTLLTKNDLPDYLTGPAAQLRTIPAVFVQLCMQVITAIQAMQKYYGMVHYDLHWENVLITFDNDNMIPLVHDFGNAQMVTVPKGARALFPELEKLNEFRDANQRERGVMTTQERVYDLQMLFVEYLLPFARSDRTFFHPTSTNFLETVATMIKAYKKNQLIGEELFTDLFAAGQSVLSIPNDM